MSTNINRPKYIVQTQETFYMPPFPSLSLLLCTPDLPYILRVNWPSSASSEY